MARRKLLKLSRGRFHLEASQNLNLVGHAAQIDYDGITRTESTLGHLAVLIAYSSVYGIKPSHADLDGIISHYDLTALIIGTVRVSLRLKSWFNDYDVRTDDELIADLFPISAPRIRAVRDSFVDGLVFARLNLLYFIKKCAERGNVHGAPIARKEDVERIGTALLMVNDLYLGYTPTASDSLIQTIAGLLPAYESLPNPRYADDIARNQIIFDNILDRPRVRSHPDFRDPRQDFAQRFGMSISDYASLIVGAVAHSINLADVKEQITSPSIFMLPSYFKKTTATPEMISRFFESVASTIEELQNSCREAQEVDFGPIQKRPLLRDHLGAYLCLDPAFLFDKAGRSFYWVLHGLYTRPESDALKRFWGEIFHSYIDWLHEVNYQGMGRYISSPTFQDSDEEIADAALLEEDKLVLFEFKASTVTAKAKFSFASDEVSAELEKKFFGRKGVGQLADSVTDLCRGRMARDFTFKTIDRVYSVLVSLDPVVNSLGVRRYFDWKFRERLAACV